MDHSIKPITRTQLIHAGRDNTVYATNLPDYLELEASDCFLSKNDATKNIVSNQSIANNRFSSAMLQYLGNNGIPTHYVGEGTNPASKIVKKATIIPLAVSCHFDAIDKSGSTNGNSALVEFTFKGNETDSPIYPKAIPLMPEMTLIKDEDEVTLIESYTQQAGELMHNFFEKLGIALIDFKLEYGRLPSGEIILCDEISPDTCSLIDIKSGQNVDKASFIINRLGHFSTEHN